MAVFSDDSWEITFASVEELFEIEGLFLEQKEVIKAFIEKVFVSLPTGAGKSLIFQSLPFVFDSLFGSPRGTIHNSGNITATSTDERPSELPVEP